MEVNVNVKSPDLESELLGVSEVFYWRLAPFRFTGRGSKLRSSSQRWTWCFEKRTFNSIRINNQWRICFVWRDGHAQQVEIVDYH